MDCVGIAHTTKDGRLSEPHYILAILKIRFDSEDPGKRIESFSFPKAWDL